MPVRVPVGFAQDSALVHGWLATVNEVTPDEAHLDPAHAIRLSCACEAARVVADAAASDPNSLRRVVVDDLRLFVQRLGNDVGRQFPIRVVPLHRLDLSAALLGLGAVLDDVATRLRPDDHASRDGRVDVSRTGWLDRDKMMDWVSASVVGVNALEDAVTNNPDLDDVETASLVRDGRGVATILAVVAVAFSDTNLIEVEHVSDRLDMGVALCDQAVEVVDGMVRLGATGLDGVRRAFADMADTFELGLDLVDAVCNRQSDSRYVVSWRLITKGRAVVSDHDVADLFASGACVDTVSPLDIQTARAFGAVASSMRLAWAA